jgi:two-component system response regulator QseB
VVRVSGVRRPAGEHVRVPTASERDPFDATDVEAYVSAARILIVEDDQELRTMLQRILSDEAYRVDAVADGQAGLHRSLVDRYDALIIDRGLPAIDGLDLTRRIRDQGVTTPVMLLTAYGSIADRVAGLDAGAEDYVIKPFDIDELLARIRALLRRNATTAGVIRLGAGVIDLTTRIARQADGTEIELSGRECALMRILSARPARTFSREELRVQVFDNADSDSIVDTYVHYLRRKLGRSVVSTARGRGYRIGTM